jgi:hypothetical protein
MTYESSCPDKIVNNFDILISLRKRNFNKKALTGRFSAFWGSRPTKMQAAEGAIAAIFRRAIAGFAHRSGQFGNFR